MSTRNLGYLGGGVLVAVVAATLLGVPFTIWLPATLVAFVIGLLVVARQAQADGNDVAARILTLGERRARPDPETTTDVAHEVPASVDARPVDIELVRRADETNDTPAVWLHRCGGRRVHRFAAADGWTVQQVSTKDPDNPRKRVIGETLTFASEDEATQAADDLARGNTPRVSDTTGRLDPSVMAAA